MVASLPECLQACENVSECVQAIYKNHICKLGSLNEIHNYKKMINHVFK